MHAAPYPLSRLVIAGALAAACAVALAPSAHADPGGRDGHSAHGRPHFDPHPRHGSFGRPAAWHAPRHAAPRYYAPPRPHYHSNLAPIIGAGILLGTVAALASPPVVVAAPPPPVVVMPAPMPMYGVTELGPAR
ncbi:MAG TPA: hypothetical protein VHA15_12115 [Burkholderiales bacterium]|nr:hypothetical protein [Burkholderiales bacterium]